MATGLVRSLGFYRGDIILWPNFGNSMRNIGVGPSWIVYESPSWVII